jgi:pimeloyl-ACP methyl ester carboxylesterase
MDKQATVVKFVTPRNYELNGLWFGPEKAITGFILLHGLSGSAFAHHDILSPLVNENTMALFFNNRGHDKIGKIRHLLPETKKGYESELVGEAHEVFTDCVDDVQGAVDLLIAKGVENVYLVGHSTGCQKSIYYLSQPSASSSVKGVILICPISDYSYALAFEHPEELKRAVSYAQNLVDEGKPYELLPLDISEDLLDAQRYISLYTPDSDEEVFPYCQTGKVPVTLQKIKTPTLVVFAGQDEYADRPAEEIGEWFKAESKAESISVCIVEGAVHNLTGQETEAANTIKEWIKK